MVQAVVQTTVTGLQGNPITATAPLANQSLTWSGSAWAPAGPFLPLSGGTLSGGLTATEIAFAGGGNLQQGATGTTNISISSAVVGMNGALQVGGTLGVGAGSTFVGQISMGAGLTGSGTIQTTGSIVGGSSSQPSQGFYLNAAGNSWGVYRLGNSTNDIIQTYSSTFYWQWNGSSGLLTYLTPSGGPSFEFFNGGNLTIAGTLSQGSDETTKNNIAAYAPGVSIAAQLQPKTFIYNNDETNTQHLGFIAQDVQPLIPDAVSSSSRENASGATVTTLSLDVTAVIAVLANTAKQLISRVAALESHNNITPTAEQIA